MPSLAITVAETSRGGKFCRKPGQNNKTFRDLYEDSYLWISGSLIARLDRRDNHPFDINDNKYRITTREREKFSRGKFDFAHARGVYAQNCSLGNICEFFQ